MLGYPLSLDFWAPIVERYRVLRSWRLLDDGSSLYSARCVSSLGDIWAVLDCGLELRRAIQM